MNTSSNRVVKVAPLVAGAAALIAVLSGMGSAGATDLASTSRMNDSGSGTLAHATPVSAKKLTHKDTGAGSPNASADARIEYLHEKLGITSAQEADWGKVAAVMHDNADKISVLAKARADKASTMTAVEDLQSYAEISGAHEDGTKNLIPVFKTLYDTMSETQKKTADTLFRGHGHHGHVAKASTRS